MGSESITPPIRGHNPEPEIGWPWCLTEYEIAYVRLFNARPIRGANWDGSPEDEVRLDQEADGIRLDRRAHSPRRIIRRWPWMAATAFSLAIALAGAAVGTLLIHDSQRLNDETQRVTEQLTND